MNPNNILTKKTLNKACSFALATIVAIEALPAAHAFKFAKKHDKLQLLTVTQIEKIQPCFVCRDQLVKSVD